MLKRNWRNNRLFCHVFVIGKIYLGRTPAPPPLAYAYAPSEENKKVFANFPARFLAFSNEISTVQKIVLSSSRGQAIFEDLRLRDQGQGLEASRPRSRTSKCVLEAKDVLEDSTSATFVLKFKDFLKNIFKWGHTQIHPHKQSFQF